MSTRIWINDNRELRWNEWPNTRDFVRYSDFGETQEVDCDLYNAALAKAKAESILLLPPNDGRIVVGDRNLIPDTFIDFEGEVEIVWQYKPYKDSFWLNCDPTVYRQYEIDKREGQYRKVARLKLVEPKKECDDCWGTGVSGGGSYGDENCSTCQGTGKDSGAHSFTEGMSDPGVKHYYLSGFTQEQAETVRKFMIMARDDARRGLKDRILNKLRNQWVEDYGALDHVTSDINAYFMVGFMNKVLDELKIK